VALFWHSKSTISYTIFISLLLAHLAKSKVSFGHHLASVIQNVWISYTVYYIDFQNFWYIIFVICIFHSTRVNLRAMILRVSTGRVCHLENVKFYMSYLQQYTKIIKMLTFRYFHKWKYQFFSRRNYFYITISVVVTSLVVLQRIHIRLHTEKLP
jgi:hypothetical protein